MAPRRTTKHPSPGSHQVPIAALAGAGALALLSFLAGCQETAPLPRTCDVPTPPRRRAGAPVAAAPRAPTAAAAQGADPLETIEVRRASFRESLARANAPEDRRAILRAASRYLEVSLIDLILPRWDGTTWSFYGTSTTPKTGSIACGYFVSTTLREAGLSVERARLAQQASEDIVITLSEPRAIARFSDVPVERFTAAVAVRGEGLYVVGLDNHVGFLIVRGGEVLFHHASYVGTGAVVREPATSSGPLADSRYRVIGKLFTDDHLAEAWLAGAAIPTKIRSAR